MEFDHIDYDRVPTHEDDIEFEHLLQKHIDSKQQRRGSDYDGHPMEEDPPAPVPPPHYYGYTNNWLGQADNMHPMQYAYPYQYMQGGYLPNPIARSGGLLPGLYTC